MIGQTRRGAVPMGRGPRGRRTGAWLAAVAVTLAACVSGEDGRDGAAGGGAPTAGPSADPDAAAAGRGAGDPGAENDDDASAGGTRDAPAGGAAPGAGNVGPPVAAGDAPTERRRALVRHRADGNRLVEGRLDLDGATTVLGASGATPVWLVAAPLGGGASLWVVVGDDGGVTAWRLDGRVATPVSPPGPTRLPPDSPPVLRRTGRGWNLVPPPPDLAPGAAPTPLVPPAGAGPDATAPADVVYVDARGRLRALGRAGPLDQGLLPDGLLTQAADGRLAALAAPTEDYGHGVLGDAVEAGEIRVYDPDLEGGRTLRLGDGEVVEGRDAMWADVDADGDADDLLVTVSRPGVGARPVAFVDAERRVDGPPVGRGFRWRHLIGAVPAPSGPFVVEVVTPHLTGTATVSRLAGDGIEPVATRDDAAASHRIGERNLDRALLVDVDGDGTADLLAQDGSSLVAYATPALRALATATLDAEATSNLAAVTVGEAALVGVGLADGRVVVVGTAR